MIGEPALEQTGCDSVVISISSLQKLPWPQVASAMCELVKEGVTHGNLSAHNVLAQSLDPVHVKVSIYALQVCPAIHHTQHHACVSNHTVSLWRVVANTCK